TSADPAYNGLDPPDVSVTNQDNDVCKTVVINTNDTGAGSLRDAIICANSTAGTDTISFNIPGSGVHTISPASALTTLTDPVIIDGYTQPLSSANTNGPGLADNSVHLIELSGASAGAGADGLKIMAGNSIVRGLAVNHFLGHGVYLLNASGTKLAG